MDSFIFQALAIELNQRLANSRLDKVVQPSAGTLVLKLWTGQEKAQLVLKAEGQCAYYLSGANYAAPAKPPRICQLLRARLRRLVEVRAEPFDRIVYFVFSGPDSASYDLIFEAFGSQGNLILTDHSGRIVDLLYRREGNRCMLPGEKYMLPQQPDRISLFGDVGQVAAAMHSAEKSGELSFPAIAPMSPPLAKVIALARRSGQSYEAVLTRINDVFNSASFVAQKVSLDQKSGMMPLSLVENGITVEEFKDLSTLVETGLAEDAESTTKDLAARMQAIIKKQYKHLAKRKEKIAAESKRQSNPELFKKYAELLLANLYNFKRGDESVEVDDFYQSPSVRITIGLDSKAAPNENADQYFKKYRKAKRSGEHHARRIQETEQEYKWLEQAELALEEAKSGEDLYQVQLELESAGLLKDAKGQLGKRKPARPEDQLYKASTPAGWQLFWGKNSRTNDYVSVSLTTANDFWFHAKGMPGSHLVLKCGDSAGTVAEDDILYAASIAAGYSKGKDAGKVEVIVANGKNVKKPKGARPGLVTVDSYSSVVVAPTRINDLKD